MLLSNRLTRWAYAGHEGQVEVHVVERLQVAEARMAEVVFAASAIETYYLRVRRVTAAFAATPFFTPGDNSGVFRGHPEMTDLRHLRLLAATPDAYIDFHSMLWWGRALLDRVEGGWGERVKGAVVDHQIGLVQFLPKRVAARIRKARDRLVRGAFAGVRDLADYSLHAFAVPSSAARLRIEADGTFAVQLPDQLPSRPVVGQEFTFNERRHVGAEAERLWHGVQAFMSEAFTILEEAQLRREEALTGIALDLVRGLRRNFMPDRVAKR